MAGADAVTRARLRAQLLTGSPAGSPEDVVGRLLAVQGQDPRGFRLAVRVRSNGFSVADVDAALTERRSLVVAWLNRGTLHLVTPEDYWWLHPLTTPQLATGITRRLEQERVTPAQADRGVAVVTDAVRRGPHTRPQLRELLDDAGVPTVGQALVHVLALASLRAPVVRGPMVGAQQAFAWAPDWCGSEPAPLDDDEALARLARRYLRGHGPADARDLATWAGIPLGRARRGLAAIDDELVAAPGGRHDLADRADSGSGVGQGGGRAASRPRLLGAYDPLLLGWASREAVVGDHGVVVTNNGLFRPTALVGGRVVGWWGLTERALTIRPLEPLTRATVAALRREVAAVLAFLQLRDRDCIVE